MASPAARRIAILFQDFAPGGAERIMVRLANQWARSRQVAILCGSARGLALHDISPAVAVIEAAPAMAGSPLSRWMLGRRAAPLLRAWQPDIVVAPGHHLLPALLTAGAPIAPTVCKFGHPISRAGPRILPAAWRAQIQRRACAPLARIVVTSPALRDEAIRYLQPDRVTLIAEPILTGAPVARRRPGSGQLRLVAAGRLVARKNMVLALRTLAALPGDAALTIVGDGPERARLEALARRLGLAHRVRFAGHVPDIGPHLDDADIFLLSSRVEGYPAVLIEALAAGLPVVATRCSPAIADIMSDRSFGRVARADPIALAAAVLSIGDGDRPRPHLLQPLLERHRLDSSAAAWLQCLDAAATERGDRP